MSISKFLIKKKIAKDEAQANLIMIGIIIVCVAFIIVSNIDFSSNSNTEMDEEFIDPLEELDANANANANNRGQYEDFDLNINL